MMNLNSPVSTMQGEMPQPATDIAPQQAIQPPSNPVPLVKAPDSISKKLDSINIAKDLDEDKLITIGKDCKEGYDSDLGSRRDWEMALEDWTKLAIQVKEEKTYPWPKASNIKFPLLSTAAMQFAARAYPTIIPSDDKPAKCRVIGNDPEGQKRARAFRIGEHMSYQLIEEMPMWEEEMDRLLIITSIAGTCFKKTYYDQINGRPESILVLPKDLVVNYWTRSLEEASRISQKIWMNKNQYQERVNAKLFLEVDLGDPEPLEDQQDKKVNRQLIAGDNDYTTPYLFIEQHTWLDLDDDGYAEPYIVTFDYNTEQVLRIVARYDEESIKTDDAGKLIKIEPVQYFTKYGFIPNPDGGFYDLGFGNLLGPLNESANTVVNQLVDAGSLSNLQSGFISKGLRIKMGESRFQPGEWKVVNATGQDLKQGIFALPVRDPSQVLFSLLNLLISSSKELASVAEIFVGKMPGQNTPASTTMASIEQGMKVFTAIFKRIYRSFTKELRKLYRLNKMYIDPQKYTDILDDPASAMDYEGSANDIVPAADPQAISDTIKQMKAEALMQLLQTGALDTNEVVKRVLEAQGQPDIQNLFRKEPPGPDPKQQEMQAKMQMEQQSHQLDMQSKQADLQVQQQLAQIQLQVEQAKLELEKQKLQLEEVRMQMEMRRMQMEQSFKQQDAELGLQAAQAKHEMGLQQAEETHQTKMKQAKESKPNDKGSTK